MKIGPIDIRNHNFSRKMRGVDEGEVRAYLDLVADRLEEILIESEDLRETIDGVQNQLGEYRQLERTLRDSLVSAERVTDDRLAQAHKEAEIVLKQAALDAERVVANARQEEMRLRSDIDDLRRQKVTYVERFRALLHSQSKILEASLESFDPDADFGEAVQEVLGHGNLQARPEDVVAPAPPDAVWADRRSSASDSAWDERRTDRAAAPTERRPSEPTSTQDSEGEPAPWENPYLGEEGLFSPSRVQPYLGSRMDEDYVPVSVHFR